MIEIQSRWKRVTDRERWAARGVSFMGKVKSTKLVWFPPTPEESGQKAASRTKETTRAAGKKTTSSTKKVTNPVRRKKA